MAHSFQENMTLALQHEMRVRELIGRSAVLPASLVVDRTQGTDLLILSDAAGMGVAARVRRSNANQFNKWEFTIRFRSRHGGATEYEKFRSGMCNWYFYGVLREDSQDFEHWMLINLACWRLAENKRDKEGGFTIWGDRKFNSDGSAFYIYSATAPRLANQHGFMVDCSDHSFPGRVAARDLARSANDNTLRRFMRCAS